MNRQVLNTASTEPLALTAQPDVEWELDTHLDQAEETEEESMWRVIIHNDDVTPMEFVVMILQRIFELLPLQAEHVMFVAHYTGMAYVCTLPLSEAKSRVGKAHFAAQLEGYPLRFTIEPE
jgi:ATP-dependent Clp protease adaptor protein ClpS